LRVKGADFGYRQIVVRDGKGHKDVSTTMIYTHVINRGSKGVQSPSDTLFQSYRPSGNGIFCPISVLGGKFEPSKYSKYSSGPKLPPALNFSKSYRFRRDTH
jgi:hypothetical protein